MKNRKKKIYQSDEICLLTWKQKKIELEKNPETDELIHHWDLWKKKNFFARWFNLLHMIPMKEHQQRAVPTKTSRGSHPPRIYQYPLQTLFHDVFTYRSQWLNYLVSPAFNERAALLNYSADGWESEKYKVWLSLWRDMLRQMLGRVDNLQAQGNGSFQKRWHRQQSEHK